MKKVLGFLAAIALMSYNLPSDKDYTVTMTPLEWNKLLYCLDHSKAEHTDVTEVQQVLLPKLQKEYERTNTPADTTRIKADSTGTGKSIKVPKSKQ